MGSSPTPRPLPGHRRATAIPPQASRAAPKTLSPSQTLDAMDSMLQVLVRSAGALGILELQNIWQVWPWHRVPMGSDPQLERCPPQHLVQGGGQGKSLLPHPPHQPPASCLLPEPLLLPQPTPPLQPCPLPVLPGTPSQMDLPVWQGEPSPAAFPLQLHHGPYPRAPTAGPQEGDHSKALGSLGGQGDVFAGGVSGRQQRQQQERDAATCLAAAGCCEGQEGHVPHPRHCPGASLAMPCCATLAHQQLFSSQLLLPFTNSQLAAVQERAMARIARLANFITTYHLPQVPSSQPGHPRCPIPVPLRPGTSQRSQAPSQQESGSRGLCPAPVLTMLSPRAGQGCPRERAGIWVQQPCPALGCCLAALEQLELTLCPGSPRACAASLPPDLPLLCTSHSPQTSVLQDTSVCDAG